jgi:hypothetical protein
MSKANETLKNHYLSHPPAHDIGAALERLDEVSGGQVGNSPQCYRGDKTMTKPNNLILTSEDDPSVFFGEVFRRPDESLERPAVAVIVFFENSTDHRDGFRVNVTAYGPHTGASTLPGGISERWSEVVQSPEGKRLLREWTQEVRAAVDREWEAVASPGHHHHGRGR